MVSGIKVLDALRKLTTLVAGLFIIIGFFQPLFIFFGLVTTLATPIIEGLIDQFYKWYHRGKTQMEMFLTEEEGAWEKLKFEVYKVVPFRGLPDILYKAYSDKLNQQYENVIEHYSTKKVKQLVYRNIQLPDYSDPTKEEEQNKDDPSKDFPPSLQIETLTNQNYPPEFIDYESEEDIKKEDE